MRIRILTGIAGEDFSWRRGQVLDLPPDQAAKWADGRRAEYVDLPAEPAPAPAPAVMPDQVPAEPIAPTPDQPADKPVPVQAPRKRTQRKTTR